MRIKKYFPAKRGNVFATIRAMFFHTAYAFGILLACYGFWGSFFPDLTLVEGTYRIVASDENLEAECLEGTNLPANPPMDKEQFMLDLLEGKYQVTYRSKILEIIRKQFGYKDNE